MEDGWLPIHSAPGYWANADGQIRTLDHVCSPSVDDHGYHRLAIWRYGRKIHRRVHQLVCEAFHGPRPEGKEVNHIDSDKLNNLPGNLEWCTARENQIHRFKSAGYKLANGQTKLTPDDVYEIRAALEAGERQTHIAKRFGVGQPTIHAIKIRRSWGHI